MTYSAGIEVLGKLPPEYAQILTPEALDFVAKSFANSNRAAKN